MIAIALGQALMSFNVAALPVAMGGMVHSFNVPPTTVGTGIVLYSLAVAGFVMLGAKLSQRFGAVPVFRTVIALFGIAQVLMAISPVATVMLLAQLLCGCNCPGSAVGSGDAEFRDEMVWITGEGYEDIPSLLSGGGQDRADDREVLRAILGTEPA